MAKQKYENHHVLPLSLCGDNFPENIVRLTAYEHKLIHMTLDIPFYKLRRFRMATNHLINRNSQPYVTKLRKLHLDFFAKTGKLPIKLQNILRDSVRETTKRIIKTHGLTLKMPKDNADIFKHLGAYHNALTLR
jgi:hypothetical protein